jgi:predicted phage tail protein
VIQARQAVGLLGLLAALAGIATNNAIVVWVAIGLLGASVLLRAVATILARKRETAAPDAGSPPD